MFFVGYVVSVGDNETKSLIIWNKLYVLIVPCLMKTHEDEDGPCHGKIPTVLSR